MVINRNFLSRPQFAVAGWLFVACGLLINNYTSLYEHRYWLFFLPGVVLMLWNRIAREAAPIWMYAVALLLLVGLIFFAQEVGIMINREYSN